ncbi:MAG: cyclic-di-AMP receptor [Tissierellales bacterium]|jgi:uncharacterized protein YaaQ|nr:cyclic-di-AMP receptor [Tissierellales bacterium]HCX04346.1 hypothetical protein [Clostridiales bacterium]
MKLIIAVIQDEDSHKLVKKLRQNNYMLTKLASTGGFLSSGNTTLLIGVDKEKVDDVLDIIRDVCKTREKVTTAAVPNAYTSSSGFVSRTINVKIGGATVFIVEVDDFIKI